MIWEDVLKRGDIVGGEIEIHQPFGPIYRAPILGFSLFEGGYIQFASPWAVELVDSIHRDHNWKAVSVRTFYVDATVSPAKDFGLGRVRFEVPEIGLGFIYPRDGGSQINQSKIEGGLPVVLASLAAETKAA